MLIQVMFCMADGLPKIAQCSVSNKTNKVV